MTIKLLTLDDVATMIGVSRSWVRDHCSRRNPKIPVVRLGTEKRAVLRFRQEDIEKFIETHLFTQDESVVEFPRKSRSM
jgi:predicted DNA-binding transcriptional regulator AlpA